MSVDAQVAGREDRERRLPALDFLRGAAALAVATGHFFIYGNAHVAAVEAIPVLAVEVFFVLSGFVLAPQVIYCVSMIRVSVLWIFLVRRWMRTVPPYIVALIFVSALYGEIGSKDFFRYAFYVQNLFNLSNTLDYYTIAWSLSIEEWFYLTFPGLCVVAAFIAQRRIVDPRRRAVFIIALIGALFIIVCATLRMVAPSAEADIAGGIRRVVIYRLDSIAIGVLLYLVVRSRTFPARYFVPLFAFFAVVAYILSTQTTSGLGARIGFPLLASSFGVTAILAALSVNHLLPHAVSKFGDWLARISYSLYLFHLIILLIVARMLAHVPLPIQFGVYLGLCLVFCTLFYSVVEAPILAARPSYRRERALSLVEPAAP